MRRLNPGVACDGLRAVCDALLSVTLAARCVACARTLESPLDSPACDDCWASIQRVAPPLCLQCGDPLPSWRVASIALAQCARCRRRPPMVDRGRSAGEYEGPLRHIIHAFKYDRHRTLAVPLGRMMVEAGSTLLQDADCVVPVPLHPWRQCRRGFNQAADLAGRLGPPVLRALWRQRWTSPQTGLVAAARRRNLHDAFRISPLLTRRHIEGNLYDRTIVLVDDVKTTGATLDACARVLKSAGAREVRALTAARAPVPR
jgi:ComF family protein